MSSVPTIRVRAANQNPIRESGNYVLYWMIASRRLNHNFALDRALELCHTLKKPLVILEALRAGYPWASDRIHRFVIQGMAHNASIAAKHPVLYYPYVEQTPDAGKGLLEELSQNASAVVTDDFPCFFLPRMVAAAAKKLGVRLEAIDSNGLLPLRATEQVFPTAYAFRRFLHKTLPQHLSHFPQPDPLAKAKLPGAPSISKSITSRWPVADPAMLQEKQSALAEIPIDHSVSPVETHGGHDAAHAQMKLFLENRFSDYGEHRNEPEQDVTSGLSPYLHFGHISVHEVFQELTRREKWDPGKLSLRPTGQREGWWNMSATAEGFLDELITWREVGYNFASHRNDYDQFESLPEWAQKTLQSHAKDERAHLYHLEQFESAATHDPLWNAAQNQLVREGRIHNYLRMLWGKKILEWSKSPKEAARIMIQLNNKYGLDGRNPNSYSGIFWVLGRYDRPWGPERPIFGTIRYMSSDNTARKVSVKQYIREYSTNGSNQTALRF